MASFPLFVAMLPFSILQLTFTLASGASPSPAPPPAPPPFPPPPPPGLPPLLPPPPSPGAPPAAPPPYVMSVGLRVLLTVAIPVGLVVLCGCLYLAACFSCDRPRQRERERLDAERDVYEADRAGEKTDAPFLRSLEGFSFTI